MTSPDDLENVTRLLASQQGTSTISKIGRLSAGSPERHRKDQSTSKAGRGDARSTGHGAEEEAGELKVDEEAIMELQGLRDHLEDAEQDEETQPTTPSPQENQTTSDAIKATLPSTDLLLEKDTPASATPSRPSSVRPSPILAPLDQSPSNAADSQSKHGKESREEREMQHSTPPSMYAEGMKPPLSISSPAHTRITQHNHRPPSLLSLGNTQKAPAPTITNSAPDARSTLRMSEELSSRSSDDRHSQGASSDEEEESDEEAEPSLKYQRLRGMVLDVVKKDTISTLTVCDKFIAFGTHAGMIFIVDFQGGLIKGLRSHTASVLDLVIDSTMEFVAAAGMDGLLSISSLTTAEHYAFDFKRPMRAVSLEPNFGRSTSRAFICGGMAGALIHREKGWLGHKETVLHGGEGPIWSCRWMGELIAWANDKGVRIYDTNTRQKITFINAPQGQSRGDLYRCNLFWQDSRTLIVGWADQIKIAKVKEKDGKAGGIATVGATSYPQLHVEITNIFQLDCAISGVAPYGNDLLVLAYLIEDEDHSSDDDSDNETSSRTFRRRAAQRPELRIIDPTTGEEKSSDILSFPGYERLSCNDYRLVPTHETPKKGAHLPAKQKHSITPTSPLFYVVSPREVIIARPRDHKDHINWLLDQKKYETALELIEAMPASEAAAQGFDARQIGRDCLSHLTDTVGDYASAASAAGKIFGNDVQAWENFVLLFLERGKLDEIVDYIPTEDPILSSIVYDMILAHFLGKDLTKLRAILDHWPTGIYSTQAVALAIEDRLQSSPVTARRSIDQELRPWTVKSDAEQTLLMEVLADLYVRNHQPGKSLPYQLRLRRPQVFNLIREHNLFLDIRDQAKQLIEFEQAMRVDAEEDGTHHGKGQQQQAIQLLVDHVHSIPVQRVVAQLDTKPAYLHLYLDALFERDPQLVMKYSDLQIELYADYGYQKLMPYLRAMSSYYSFEKAFRICEVHDYVPEMVFLLGRVGDNKRALNLIIERLNDVSRAIDFAKEQNDDDLWEDLLRYSEDRPAFIRGLLENVGAEIDPIRLIRRIKDGLEIVGLKSALVKILHDFNLQISLLEGCVSILYHDVWSLQEDLMEGQSQAHYCEPETITAASGAREGGNSSICSACSRALFSRHRQVPFLAGSVAGDSTSSQPSPSILFLCRHAYHLTCLLTTAGSVPPRRTKGNVVDVAAVTTTATQVASMARVLSVQGVGGEGDAQESSLAWQSSNGPASRARRAEEEFREKIAYSSRLRGALRARGCPTCRNEAQSSMEAEPKGLITSAM